MSSWKSIGHVSAALVPLILGGCSDMAVRDYHRIPYCCDRTAGTGVELYYPAERTAAMEPAPSYIEPAAGGEDQAERIFRDATKK